MALGTSLCIAPPIVRVVHLVGALLELTKPRLAFFSILTGVVGYLVAVPGGGWLRFCMAALGTCLAAGGTLAFNQWWERDTDPWMRRTAGRPLPRQEITPRLALSWSLALSLGGVVLLAAGTTGTAAAIAIIISVLYGWIYTPLKRRTRWATEIGSLSGALPPLLGAAAAGDVFTRPAWALSAAILFWQMPHFYAIGWMHREDYRAAGFPLLPAVDPTETRTAAWSLAYALLLVGVSVLPWALGWVGAIYGVVATCGALVLVVASARFLVDDQARDLRSRQLFLATLAYLPLVMVALMIDRR